jgi:hypothetical protein
MKKTILSLVLLLSLFVTAQAQRRSSGSSRNWAVGLRLGDPAGLNVRKYFGNKALEVNLGSTGMFYGNESKYSYNGYSGHRASGIALGINYIGQKNFSGAEGLEWYWGLGGQLSSRRFYYYDDDFYKNGYYYRGYYETRVSLGANALLGLEWTIPSTPISLFSDLGLHLEIAPSPFWYYVPVGVGGRFSF